MSRSYERLVGMLALLSVLGGLGYAAVFLRQQIYGGDLFLDGLCLTLGGLLSLGVMLAVYLRVRSAEPAFAALGLVLIVLGANGAITKGGYFMALASGSDHHGLLNPSETDPVSLMTFGVAGLGYLCLAWAMVRSSAFPRFLSLSGAGVGAAAVALYLLRLVDFGSSQALLSASLIEVIGVLVAAAWFVSVGVTLVRTPKAKASSEPRMV